jgi:hypothetical protein
MRHKALATSALAAAALGVSACGSAAATGPAVSCKVDGSDIRETVRAGSSAVSLSDARVQLYDHDGQPMTRFAVSFPDSDGDPIQTLPAHKTATGFLATGNGALASCNVLLHP